MPPKFTLEKILVRAQLRAALKRVLLIAFYFPPRNHVASYRTGCFAKYLPENGWLPTVICQDWPADGRDSDPNFVGKIPDEVKIVRVPQPPYRTFYERMVVRKLLPYVSPHFAPHLWSQKATEAITQLCRETQFDAIWATSDPIVTMGLASQAAKRINKPWIADLRDTYSLVPFGSWYKRPIWAYHERRLCRDANAVAIVSPTWAREISPKIGKQVHVIENGYDPALFPTGVQPDKSIFTISYTGSIVRLENPNLFMDGLRVALSSGTIPRDKIEVRFYGPSVEQINETCPGALETLPVKSYPKVPHKQVIEIQQKSAALLLLTCTDHPGVLPAKIFDYLGAKRPILLAPDDGGDACDIVRRTGAGEITSTPQEIAAVLTKWYAEWKQTGDIKLSRNEQAVEHYSRRDQTRRLAALLDSLSPVR